jgi:protein-S-isoprenylcysteine O-methyltransferase Ste14
MRKIFSLIVGVIFFIALPIIAWGLNDFKGYFNNPARLGYVIIMIVMMILVVIFVPEEGRSRGKGIKTDKLHNFSLALIQIFTILIVILSPFSDRNGFVQFPENLMIRFLGLGLTIFGYFLMNWSVIALGRQFSVNVTLQEDHKLITNGPYSLIRHPRYLGILIFFTGISFIFLSVIGLILMVITFIILIWRIRDEEKLMHSEFKEEWEEYRKRTYYILPYIY